MKFTIYQESRIGQRSNNQDRLLYRYSSEALLMVVADGMGGHSHGEVAAQIATVRIAKCFEQYAQPRIDDPAKFLVDALFDAHLAVKMLTSEQPRPPHTTCIACIVQDGRVWWAHAGDSRLYLIRDGLLLARTRDHSYVEGLLQRGLITPQQALKHPQRNLVLSCLGAQEKPHIDHQSHGLEAGDVLLLCSDGVWEPLPEHVLIGAFGNHDVASVAPQLLDLAASNAGDNGDNLTLIAMRWEGNDAGPATVANFPDTVFDISHGTSPELLSDDDIERAIAEIRIRINPDFKPK
jgi:serine/threonine protein phosphatase PrpC